MASSPTPEPLHACTIQIAFVIMFITGGMGVALIVCNVAGCTGGGDTAARLLGASKTDSFFFISPAACLWEGWLVKLGDSGMQTLAYMS